VVPDQNQGRICLHPKQKSTAHQPTFLFRRKFDTASKFWRHFPFFSKRIHQVRPGGGGGGGAASIVFFLLRVMGWWGGGGGGGGGSPQVCLFSTVLMNLHKSVASLGEI